ncbi:Panacea domain-containing protein [Flavobacterium oreochromis]|uniref:Panacea domain-containing protein n=1 Tax=Flavobacterium oreochromis TaxID=2906078 RepID=UPI00385A2369
MENFNLEIFNESKALNAVLLICHKLKRKDFHKIFKILYFSDRDHISEYGRSITGDTYIAMQDGPVPSKIYDILKSVRGDGYFKDNGKFSKLFEIEKWDLVFPKEEPNLKSLSKTDIEMINNALSKYGDLTWDEVREKSHDYAWSNTALNTPISIDNLVFETGNNEDYLDYIKQNLKLRMSIS